MIVDSRCAIRIVITSAFCPTSRMVEVISSSVIESSDEVASSNTSSRGLRSNARAIDSRCFSPPETFTPPSPISVSRPLSARASSESRSRSPQHFQAFRIRGVRPDEQQVLANGA